jgi:hypothetical protein
MHSIFDDGEVSINKKLSNRNIVLQEAAGSCDDSLEADSMVD